MKWIAKIKEFGRICWCALGGVALVLGLLWGAIAYDNTKADAATVQKIEKNLATLTQLVTQDKLQESIRDTEREIFRMEQQYKTKPMPQAELSHYLFLKEQLQNLKDMQNR